MKKIDILILLGAILLVVLGFLGGYRVAKAGYPDITERTDTVTVRDSLPFYYPIPKDSAVIRYVNVPVIVTINDSNVINVNGNVNANVNVPIERKVYEEDSTYYAVVTGPAVGDLHPSLDTLKVYRETFTIETTRTVTSYKAFRWSVGPFLDQEVGLGHYAAKVGLQADLSLGGSGRWRFVPEVGYRWTSIEDGGWYAGGMIRFELARGK